MVISPRQVGPQQQLGGGGVGGGGLCDWAWDTLCSHSLGHPGGGGRQGTEK